MLYLWNLCDSNNKMAIITRPVPQKNISEPSGKRFCQANSLSVFSSLCLHSHIPWSWAYERGYNKSHPENYSSFIFNCGNVMLLLPSCLKPSWLTSGVGLFHCSANSILLEEEQPHAMGKARCGGQGPSRQGKSCSLLACALTRRWLTWMGAKEGNGGWAVGTLAAKPVAPHETRDFQKATGITDMEGGSEALLQGGSTSFFKLRYSCFTMLYYFLLLLLLLSHFSHVWLFATPWTAAYQAPLSMGFSRQEYWSGVPLPSPIFCYMYTYIPPSWISFRPPSKPSI